MAIYKFQNYHKWISYQRKLKKDEILQSQYFTGKKHFYLSKGFTIKFLFHKL